MPVKTGAAVEVVEVVVVEVRAEAATRAPAIVGKPVVERCADG